MTSFTHVEIRIPDRWLRGRSATTRILVKQEAKYVEQEEDRHNVQIGKKTLKWSKTRYDFVSDVKLIVFTSK